jgi:hypothetical protein
MFSST